MTHTLSVFLLGLVALFASKYFLPGDLIPWMGGLSGLMILVMGIYLIFARWRQYKHPDPNLFENEHNHMTHTHTHDGVTHTHAVPQTGVPLMSLVALGISGGIVPCPDAFAVLLIAISLNRVLLGLVIILAFSLGLALVLITIGILMVKAKPVVDRITGGGKAVRLYLPMASAILVTILGAVILVKSLGQV
jgi:ABC-type nickel/cobalt efflux system permease component RcnA